MKCLQTLVQLKYCEVPTNNDYDHLLLSNRPPPFPIIGLNLHPKLIIGSQGSYGLMCGLNEAIENRSSSGLQRIIVRQGKYFQMKLVTFTCDASDKNCFSKKACFSHWSVCKGRMSGNNYIIIEERLPSCLDNNTTLFAPSATD